jgi:hypothetical protein
LFIAVNNRIRHCFTYRHIDSKNDIVSRPKSAQEFGCGLSGRPN